MGRFMSPDPLGGHLENLQSLNKYAYALNNPLTNTDPTGLDSYLQCTQTEDNASTCRSQTVGYDSKGNAQTATVQGVTQNGQFTVTQIGNVARYRQLRLNFRIVHQSGATIVCCKPTCKLSDDHRVER
jgi:hypothetical protein